MGEGDGLFKSCDIGIAKNTISDWGWSEIGKKYATSLVPKNAT